MISNPLLVYLLLGPLAWVLMEIGTRMGSFKMKRLLRWQRPLPENPPRVTILVPAKDEGAGIRTCLDAVLALDYPNFDVIAVDDRSTDDTGAILDQVAQADPRLRVIHIPAGGLPGGWLGKCHALHLGTRGVSSDWLFFVDSDVTVRPAALATALSMAAHRGYHAISILTRLECPSFIERLMLPPLAAAWAIMHTIARTNEDSYKDSAVANGQFFLIRRDAYEAAGGHEAVKDQITEDVELMRLLKSQQRKVRIYFGGHLATTRMHGNLRQMFHGWGRIYSGTARRKPWRILWAMWFIISAVFTLYPALAWGIYQAATGGGSAWLAAAGLHWAMMSLFLMRVYQISGNPGRYALAIPVSGSLMLAILAYALRKCQTGKITWRDTEFAAAPAPPRSSTAK